MSRLWTRHLFLAAVASSCRILFQPILLEFLLRIYKLDASTTQSRPKIEVSDGLYGKKKIKKFQL